MGDRSKKHGRNKATSARYASEGRREINKAKRMFWRLHRHPNDKTARGALDSIPATRISKARAELKATGAKYLSRD